MLYKDLLKTPEYAQLSIDEKRFIKANWVSDKPGNKTRVAVMLERARKKAEAVTRLHSPARSKTPSDDASL
jgi:hypothetical protein